MNLRDSVSFAEDVFPARCAAWVAAIFGPWKEFRVVEAISELVEDFNIVGVGVGEDLRGGEEEEEEKGGHGGGGVGGSSERVKRKCLMKC